LQPLARLLFAEKISIFLRQTEHFFSELEQFSHKTEILLNTSD